ncbi:MAG: pirin family protein [Deltaproteobacteria bacterium]|nr:pirin family protein [Deltaproteobacteria bacterium]
MSLRPALDPQCSESSPERVVTTIIDARPRDLGGLEVRRVLPSMARRMVGPFTFFDEMGAVELSPGQGVDVRPHPHIGLATVTYLFEGELLHRDSLGSHQLIRPGDINWMTAGRGIVHSERTPGDRKAAARLHGLQLWVALPQAYEETTPSFHHHPGETLPVRDSDGVHLRVLAGTAYGMTSPVEILSPLFYVEALMPAGRELALPPEYEERCIYVIEGAIHTGAEGAEAGRMLVFDPKTQVVLRAERASRIVLLGGAPLEGKRYIDWNFVSSSKEKIEQAKRDWKDGRFPKVPGDEVEFVPLPGSSS